MNFKKSLFLFLIANSIFNLSLHCFALDDREDAELDEFIFDTQELPDTVTTRAIAPIIAQFALQDNTIPTPYEVLYQPLYIRTNPIRRRSILDNPLFQQDLHYRTAHFTITPFFDFTDKGCFYSNNTTIKGYVDLVQGDVPEKIETVIKGLMAAGDPGIDADTVATFSSLDIPDTLELFHNIKVQEKQLGFMLRHVYSPHDTWKIDIRLPLLWQIYNFYLTPAEQDVIEKQPLMQLFPAADFMPFAKAHLISDKIGISDMQVRLEIPLKELPTSSYGVGFSLGIPTACAFKKGVYGSYFDKKTPTPDFDLVRDIINLLEDNFNDLEGVKKNGANLALAALDRLSSVLLDHPLGRDGHWTLGAYYRSRLDFTPQLKLTSTAGFICPFTGTEDRFIKTNITIPEIQTLQAMPVGTDQEANLALGKYNELLLRKLFPQSYKCSIFPGVIFMNNSCLTYTKNKWALSLGSDMWCQTKERLKSIKTDTDISTLDTANILNDYAFQSQTYVRIQYHNPASSWTYTITGAYAGLTDRIGSSTTISLNIQRHF